MSVVLQKLSKTYGKQKAVDEISFEIARGEIVGFLGPNGAGKSTTMKMLSCFIPPSSGDAVVEGFSIHKDSMAIRRITGYLPEHNPLYGDMYVQEYLAFVASLHGLKSEAASRRIRDLIEMTGLAVERSKKIGQLSKGYKQRVGIAQAMMHDPKVLILDEPTSGLDPNQLVEIRQLIRELGREKTLILSTHIMQEVQAMCSRVIIINKGKIVADDSTEALKTQSDVHRVKVEFKQSVSWEKLMSIPGLKSAREESDQVWVLSSDKREDLREAVSDFALKNQLTLLRLERMESSLEDVFKERTK